MKGGWQSVLGRLIEWLLWRPPGTKRRRRNRLRNLIKKGFDRWHPKQSAFTRGEMRIRDSLSRPLCLRLYSIGVTANRLTAVGALLLFSWVVAREVFAVQSLWLHIGLGVAVGISDFFDGPIARNTGTVTARGTLGDYWRDFFYVLYMLRIGFDFDIPILGVRVYPWLVACILVFEVFAVYFKFCAWYYFADGEWTEEKFLDFAEENFQSTIEDRMQFVSICLGMLVFVIGGAYEAMVFVIFGYGALTMSLGFGFYTMRKEANWRSLTEDGEDGGDET